MTLYKITKISYFLKLCIVFPVVTIICSCSTGNLTAHSEVQYENIEALYTTINDDKELYLILNTTQKNDISDIVFISLLKKLSYIDSLKKSYNLEWLEKRLESDEQYSTKTIDSLCVANLFLQRYKSQYGEIDHQFLKETYDMSLSFQNQYINILKTSIEQSEFEYSSHSDCLNNLGTDSD